MGPELDPEGVPEDPMWWEELTHEEDPFLYPSIGEEEGDSEIL